MHVENVPDYFLGTIIAVQDSPRVGTKELLCEKFCAPRFFPDGRLKVPPESNLQIPSGGPLRRNVGIRRRPAKLTSLHQVSSGLN